MENHQSTKVYNKREEITIKLWNSQKAIKKMASVSPFISIITLNVNGMNYPIKSHRVAG